jgi:hypothetical protein
MISQSSVISFKEAIARSNPMTELKLTSKHSGSLKPLSAGAIAEALRVTEDGMCQTAQWLKEFEEKYQLSTAEFLYRYKNDECEETIDLDEWIGESRMLQRLQDRADQLRGIEFAN